MEPFTLEEIKQIGHIPMNFLIGKERSGTTLLQIILNAHPNIAAPPESRFIMLLYSRYGKVTKWTERTIHNFYNDLLKEKAYKNFWGNHNKTLLASLLEAKEIATFSLLCKIIFYHECLNDPLGHSSPRIEIRMFFDKNPVYSYFLPELKKIFPEAKYIHLVRDYRANIASHRRVFVIKQSADISYRWLKMNMEIEKAKAENKEHYFTLKYEDLVTDPSKSMQQLCGFLGIPFYEKMALEHSQGIYSSYSKNIKPRFRSIHDKIFRPISPSFIDEWKRKLTDADILQAEKIAGEHGEKMYGYTRFSIDDSLKKKAKDNFLMKTKYSIIKKIYTTAMRNPRLYFIITKYVWKSF